MVGNIMHGYIAFQPYASLRHVLVGLSFMEWIVMCLCIGLVLSAEAVNSIKALARVSPAYDGAIKHTKDLAAGAVLLLAIASAVVGLIILLPKLTLLCHEKTDFYTICSDSFLSVCAQEIEVNGTRKAVRTSGDVGALLLPVAGVAPRVASKRLARIESEAYFQKRSNDTRK